MLIGHRGNTLVLGHYASYIHGFSHLVYVDTYNLRGTTTWYTRAGEGNLYLIIVVEPGYAREACVLSSIHQQRPRSQRKSSQCPSSFFYRNDLFRKDHHNDLSVLINRDDLGLSYVFTG